MEFLIGLRPCANHRGLLVASKVHSWELELIRGVITGVWKMTEQKSNLQHISIYVLASFQPPPSFARGRAWERG